METALHYDPSQRHLSFLLKEGITTNPDVQLRFRGKLNTVTGSFDYHATAQKYFSSGPSMKDSLTQPLRMGFGVGVSNSHNDEPFLAATASKKISLLEGDHTQLSAKAQLELEPRSNKMTRTAKVSVSRRFLDFTAHQDLQLSAGLDVEWPRPANSAVGSARSSSSISSNKVKADITISLRENNWGIHYRRGQWGLTYDL